MINTLFLTLQLSNLLLLLRFSTRKHSPWPLVPFFQISFKNCELKTDPQYLSGLSCALSLTTFLETAVYYHNSPQQQLAFYKRPYLIKMFFGLQAKQSHCSSVIVDFQQILIHHYFYLNNQARKQVTTWKKESQMLFAAVTLNSECSYKKG